MSYGNNKCPRCESKFGKAALHALCRACFIKLSTLPPKAARSLVHSLLREHEPLRRPRRKKGRRELALREGERLRFRARLVRFGMKASYRGPDIKTALLADVIFVDTGERAAEHIWIAAGKWAHEAREGDALEFDARVKRYSKGYMGRRLGALIERPASVDWRLSRPNGFAIIGKRSG